MTRAESLGPCFVTRVSAGGHAALADVTADKGGAGVGFRPHELLEAALASCMAITARMLAEHHAIPLAQIAVDVQLDRCDPQAPVFDYHVELADAAGVPLPAPQRERVLTALTRCPVHATLSAPLRFRLGE